MRDHSPKSAADIPVNTPAVELTDTVVDQYLAGELPAGDVPPVRQAIEARQEWRRFLQLLKFWLAEPNIPEGPSVLEALARFQRARRVGRGTAAVTWRSGESFGQRRTGEQTVRMTGSRAGRFVGQTLRWGLWIGALSAVIGGLVILGRRDGEIHTDMRHLYATGAYQQAILNLDDGTRVTLAPQTTLRVLQFGKQARTVALESGEAYFEVAHTSGAPFIVRSGAAAAQVLGTSFLVRHDVGDRHVRVAVTDGKVRVTTPARANAGITLTIGQIGDVTDSTVHMSTTDDLRPGTEWAPGRIMFRDTPLATVLQTVSRWYGYQFRYADQTLGARSVTMIVSTRSSAEALAELERVLAVNLTVVGDTITLAPQPPQSSRSAPRIRTYDVWAPTREVGR